MEGGAPSRDVSALKARIKGTVATPSDADFATLALGGLWNQLRPTRLPQLIAQVRDDQDVVEAVRFARAHDLKVTVRGGGHSWCHSSLRAGGLLIDLTRLNEVVSLDREARTAVVEPVISNREMQALLNPHGLSYPTGHCPQVKLSGYLLSGGMSWNQGAWGNGTHSVEAIDLVTPDGELITASEDRHADYFWAARGGGSGLFAAAVRFHLRLQPLPRAMMATDFHCPLDQIEAVADWLASIAGSIPANVELSLFVLQAPPELAAQCSDFNGKVCLVTATSFADSEEEARAGLQPLEACPVPQLSNSPPAPTDFEALFDASGALWPEGQRSAVDALFYDANPAELVRVTREHFVRAPSPTTVLLFAIFTGPGVPARLPDGAFSMSARIYGGPWTMWSEPSEDAANRAWHAKCVELLEPLAVGHYIGETDIAGHPEYAARAYSAANWQRLRDLRAKHDPDGVFFSGADGLN